ncbi:hypothetical protein [Methylomonas methanica]|uniref:Uncharacterized protein n=1 Tax=Methylomonas methanica (strain DSM 25384 / MC09) TaxID=857087 RepID=F9ZZ69_METMM|nr:hypothetical protein [Methylomonas methanica]AEG01095.1 hypothetical protein Metme_2710 [Methylomonas methanica MC09]
MKLNKASSVFLFVSTIMSVNTAFGHSLTTKTLRQTFGASATDVWKVTCSGDALLGDSHHLAAQILDRSNDKNSLPLVIVKGNNAITTVDPVGGDSTMSPLVELNGGNGDYLMIVNYTKPITQLYNIEYHCESATGDHTPTTTPGSAIQDN